MYFLLVHRFWIFKEDNESDSSFLQKNTGTQPAFYVRFDCNISKSSQKVCKGPQYVSLRRPLCVCAGEWMKRVCVCVWRGKRERISFYWLDVVRPLYGGKRRGISHAVCGDFRKRKAFKKRPQRKLGEVGGKSKTSGQELVWNYSCPESSTHTHRIRNVFMFLAARAAESSRVRWHGRKASFRLPLLYRMSRPRILSIDSCSV